MRVLSVEYCGGGDTVKVSLADDYREIDRKPQTQSFGSVLTKSNVSRSNFYLLKSTSFAKVNAVCLGKEGRCKMVFLLFYLNLPFRDITCRDIFARNTVPYFALKKRWNTQLYT